MPHTAPQRGPLRTLTLIRRALCELFKSEADFDVCGEAENGQEAIEKAQELHPDLIVLDLSMPIMNGIDAARVLKTLMPGSAADCLQRVQRCVL